MQNNDIPKERDECVGMQAAAASETRTQQSRDVMGQGGQHHESGIERMEKKTELRVQTLKTGSWDV